MTDDETTSVVTITEDEAGMCLLYRDWLRTADPDYDVATFARGREALDHLDANVDLLVCDRLLPDVSGDQVIASLPETDFDGPVLVVSALDEDVPLGHYTDDPIPHDRVVAYLRKPVSRAAFLTAVADALAQ